MRSHPWYDVTMIERYTHGKLRWINLKQPSTEEIRTAMIELDMPPLLMSDLSTPIPRNHATCMDSVIKIILDFPTVKVIDIAHPREIKFLIAKHSLLTVQYEEMSGFDHFKRQFEVAATLRKKQTEITGAHIFFSLLNTLYDSTYAKLDYIESLLKNIEMQLIENHKKNLIYEISDVSKKLIAFRHTLRGHEDVFREARPFFDTVYDQAFTTDIEHMHTQYFILIREAQTQFETLIALRESNTALIYTRQNEIMINLTMMAFVTFPLTLLSSLFAIEAVSTPIVGTEHDFWIIVSILFGVGVCFFLFFKRKNWI